MRKLFVFLLFAGLLTNCEDATLKYTILDKFLGVWEIKGEKVYERWSKNSDGSYTSVMFSCQQPDTNYSEKVKVYKNQSGWTFETLVKNQNGGRPVKFQSTQMSDTGITFQNSAHDFPKTISYTLETPSLLKAYITDGIDTIRFNFSKLK